jgi:hypothetical protein
MPSHAYARMMACHGIAQKWTAAFAQPLGVAANKTTCPICRRTDHATGFRIHVTTLVLAGGDSAHAPNGLIL